MQAHRRRLGPQRGAAALFVVTMLCFVTVLAVALAHRNVLVEEQRSANELRSHTGFAAADAGLEWALARINDATPMAATCLPSGDAATPSFRDRMLRIVAASGAVTPTTWDDAGRATPLRAACVRGAAGWACSCPATGRPMLPAVAVGALAPTFFVELAPSTRPGVVRVLATGCTRTSADRCAADTAAGREASAAVEAAWALMPALRSAPAAALTIGGDLAVGAASLGVANAEAAGGGLAIDAGGRIVASALRIGAPLGATLGQAIVASDETLPDAANGRLFARHFGMDRVTWAAQPAVHKVSCESDCTQAVTTAIAAGARLLAFDGDVALAGPLALGTADDPVALVVSGALGLSGDVTMHGVVYAASLAWNDTVPGRAFIRGAVVVAGDVRGNANADIVRDAAVLERLSSARGSFVRVNGSWKDF
jgi:hypothetical protein